MKKTICLNMIVKNEALVIERCLESVKPLIDYWVIVDTGSTDDTQEIIRKYLAGIPGELHQRPWVNFAHNRNEALRLAKKKCEYLLPIDADEYLEYSTTFRLPKLEKDVYFIIVRQVDAADAKRNGIVKSSLDWKWQGEIHEALISDQARTHEVLHGVRNICNQLNGSGRSQDPQKYLKDALLLEKLIEKEPTNSRYVYYLGISYSACDQYEKAIAAFEKRMRMPSSDLQETYLSIYNTALLYDKLGKYDLAIPLYFQSFNMHPIRSEPLFRAAVLYRTMGNPFLGYLLTKHALSLPYPSEDLCIEYLIYDHKLLTEYANCTLLTGRFQEGFQACCQLLSNPNLPDSMRPQVQSNYELAKTKLEEVKRFEFVHRKQAEFS